MHATNQLIWCYFFLSHLTVSIDKMKTYVYICISFEKKKKTLKNEAIDAREYSLVIGNRMYRNLIIWTLDVLCTSVRFTALYFWNRKRTQSESSQFKKKTNFIWMWLKREFISKIWVNTCSKISKIVLSCLVFNWNHSIYIVLLHTHFSLLKWKA